VFLIEFQTGRMDTEDFNQDDPWHSNANLIFGFGCQDCPAWIDMNWDIANKDTDSGFLKACVELSERAKRDGWECIGEFTFLCPECASKSVAG